MNLDMQPMIIEKHLHLPDLWNPAKRARPIQHFTAVWILERPSAVVEGHQR